MIKRRQPIQSVLAGRKMFANGGVVPPAQPQAPIPMQQPQGIMASSQPLMEAVVSDALNPMGGGTLAESDGTLSMAQGGAVGFQEGGANFAPLWGSRTQVGLGAGPQDMRRRAEMGRGELAQEMFPYEASTGPLVFSNRPGPAGLGQPPGPSRPIVSALRVPTDFLDQSIRSLSQINASLGRILYDTAEFIGSKRDWSGINPLNAYGQIEAVNAALRRAPEVEGVSSEEVGNAISSIAKDTVAQDPNITGKKLSGIIAENIRDTFESGYLMAQAEVELDPNEPEPVDMAGMEAMPGEGEIQPADDLGFDPAELAGGAPRGGDGPPAGVDQEPSDLSDDPKVQERQRAADAEREAFLEGKPGFLEAKLAGGARQVAETFDKPGMPPDEATKTLEDHVARFKEAMPEYEGATEQERGWMIFEAALKIMAGQSPDAITNIANGLKGLGPQFAKNAKEKRAWKRQVDLSAAKYALATAEARRAEEVRLAEEGRKRPFELIATKDYVDEGTSLTVKRGTAVPLTNQQITDGYLTKYPLTYRETFLSEAKALAKLAEANKDKLLKPQFFSNDRKTYVENARSVKNGIRMKALLMEAANLAVPEGTEGTQVLGAVPLFKSWVNKAWNAAGYQLDTTEGQKKLKTLRSNDIDKYRTLMKTIGTTMVTEILNESNKTISEGDRQRVDDLVAAYSDFDGTFASYESLLIKLKNLEQSINNGISSAAYSMKGIEDQWGTAEFIGGGKAGEVMQRIREGVGTSGYTVGERRSQAIPYKDIIDMTTRKFTPKYQTIFGKR